MLRDLARRQSGKGSGAGRRILTLPPDCSREPARGSVLIHTTTTNREQARGYKNHRSLGAVPRRVRVRGTSGVLACEITVDGRNLSSVDQTSMDGFTEQEKRL